MLAYAAERERGDNRLESVLGYYDADRIMGRPALAAHDIHQQSSERLHVGLDTRPCAVRAGNAVHLGEVCKRDENFVGKGVSLRAITSRPPTASPWYRSASIWRRLPRSSSIAASCARGSASART